MKRLNQQLTNWAIENTPADQVMEQNLWSQVRFIRDELPDAICADNNYEALDKLRDNIRVIASYEIPHGSLLPVYEITLPSGLRLIMRYDFESWLISVQSYEPINANFLDLFDPGENVKSGRCDNMPEDLIFDSYNQNRHRFTICLTNCAYARVYTFVYILVHSR